MKRLLLLSAVLISSTVLADEIKTPTVVVTAAKYQTNSFDIPMSLDVIDSEVLQDSKFTFTPADSIKRVPGLEVSDTSLSDIRIVTRGFGSYAPFASRGIQIYRDGIPVSMADGYGSTSLIDMNTIGRVEVLKGPFSSMYGNTAAGVAQFFTKKPTVPNEVSAKFVAGSNGTRQSSYEYSGMNKNGQYSITHSDFTTNGYKDYTGFDRTQTSLNYWLGSGTDTRTHFNVNNYNQTAKEDSGNGNSGITVARYNSDPYSAEPSVYNIGSWKNVRQTDANVTVEHDINSDNMVKASLWGGHRTQEQLQSTSACATLVTCSSGLLKTDRLFYGSDLRYDHTGYILRPYKVSAGLMYYSQEDDVTTGTWMTNGVLAADRGNTLSKNWTQNNKSFDQYVQGTVFLTPTIDVHGGLRRTNTDIEFIDNLTSSSFGGDNGGSMNYKNTLGNIGVNWKVLETTNLYASYGEGVETPNMVQVQSAQAISTTGPNTTLKPTKSDNYEIGIKTFAIPRTYLTASVYKSNIKDIINIAQNTGGYKIYSNQGDATTNGFELSAKTDLPYGFGTYVMYNYIDSTFDSNGNKIPGIAQNNAFSELSWKYNPLGFKVSTEAIYVGKTYATTDNTVSTDAYTLFNLKASLNQKVKSWNFKEYVAVNNIVDRTYVEAVAVDGSYSRYFVTGPGRTSLIGVNASYDF